MATPGSNPNAPDFLLPDLGEGLEEAELIEWCVAEGQVVEEFETLAKMETAKALVEVPAPRAGTIARLHGKAGDIIKVGKPLVSFDNVQEAARPDAGPPAKRNGTHADLPRETLKQQQRQGPQDLADPGETGVGDESEEIREDAGTVVGALSAIGGVTAEPGQVLAAPAVRRLAREMGVDLTSLNGSGIGGRVTASDVKAAAGQNSNGSGRHAAAGVKPAPARPIRTPPTAKAANAGALPEPDAPPFSLGGSEETVAIPFRGVRRTIANRLRESVDKAVHFAVMDEADVSGLDGARKRLAAASGEKLSLLPFACLAVARALAGEFGYALNRLNAHVDDEKGEIVQHRRVHLGIAVDTPSGLMVPVLRDANRLGVLEVGRKIAQLATAARDRSIPASDMAGSTFTISNFGSYAGRFASPILNYPEVGILAVGRMREGVVVRNGMMGVGKLLPLSLVCDHRVVDGGTATMFLNQIITLLQSPDVLLPSAT